MKVLMAESSNFRGPTHVGSHAYADAFAGDGKDVLWIGTPLHLKNLLMKTQNVGEDTALRRLSWRRGGEVVGERITVYYPFTILPVVDRPLLRSAFALRNTLRLTIPPLKRTLARLGYLQPDVLWLSQSRFSNPLRSIVRAKYTAYRMSDDWSYFENVPKSLIHSESEIIREADTVFVTSRRLEERVRAICSDVVYLPNGVDGAFFEDRAEEPRVLGPYPRPRVIFAGTLAFWVDMKLVSKAALACPEASFLLAGPMRDDRFVKGLPKNVRYLGVRPYSEIPAILQHCDVGIIPFRKSPLTDAANPVKLFEYLASGLPVVSTSLEEIAGAGSPALLCGDEEAFVKTLSGLLSGEIPWDKSKAISFAREQTWQHRYQTVRAVLGI
jgi:glycosyltransferase involved in cell wall biosynthesis